MSNTITVPVLLLIVSMVACNSRSVQYEKQRQNANALFEKQHQCAIELAQQNSASSEGLEFNAQLEERLRSWLDQDDHDWMNRFRGKDCMVSDIVLFNSEKDKAKGHIIRFRDEGGHTDHVETVYSRKVNGRWEFKHLKNGTMTFQFTKCDACPARFDTISAVAIEKRLLRNWVEMGYYLDNPLCQINEGFFEDWEYYKNHDWD